MPQTINTGSLEVNWLRNGGWRASGRRREDYGILRAGSVCIHRGGEEENWHYEATYHHQDSFSAWICRTYRMGAVIPEE